MSYFWTVLFFALGISPLYAQQNGLGTWNILNVKYAFSDKFILFGEGQIRSLKIYDDFHYHELKGGVDYKLFPNMRLAIAAGSYQTYKEGGNFVTPKNNDEFRIWPQLTLNQSVGKFKIEQRYRAEFRFTSNGYRNRFRYRVGISLPFGKKTNGYQPFQISANNELFFTNNEPYFERNRSSISLSYRFSKLLSIQVGYLHQFDYKINDETGRDFLQIGCYFEFSRENKSKN